MTKKIEPSQAYLEILEKDLAAAQIRFNVAKKLLYERVAIAKLGEPEFESARKACLESNKDITRLDEEIIKVRKALAK
jgi:hypothetical protein